MYEKIKKSLKEVKGSNNEENLSQFLLDLIELSNSKIVIVRSCFYCPFYSARIKMCTEYLKDIDLEKAKMIGSFPKFCKFHTFDDYEFFIGEALALPNAPDQ